MYKISIVIPIYNVEEYVEECILSVINNLPNNVQVICVNDGTPDNSMKIVRNIVNSYSENVQSQFVFIDQENRGLSEARNTGINSSSGEYIGFLDSDDKLKKDYFKVILKTINNEEYDIIDFNIITSDGSILKTREKSYDSIYKLMNWYCPARVYNKNIIKKYKFTKDIYYEDLDLVPKLYEESSKTKHLNYSLYWYRNNDYGITNLYSEYNNIKTLKSLEKILWNYMRLYEETSSRYFAAIVLQVYFLLCVNACKRYNIKKSLYYISRYEKIISILGIGKISGIENVINLKVNNFFKRPYKYIFVYSIYGFLKKLG